jgi:glucokinase
MTNDLVIAADLGGTHLRAAVVDKEGQMYERIKLSTPNKGPAEELVDALVNAVDTLKKGIEDKGNNIHAVSIAVPASLNFQEGLIAQAPNLPFLDNFRLADALKERISLPVILENDANAAAIGEMWQGAGRNYNTLLCLTLGTGVGGGIILNKQAWRGIDGTAAELGHLIVEPQGYPCGCRGRGCLEVYGSATAIVRMTYELLPTYPTSHLAHARSITAAEVYNWGMKGDQLALEVFRKMGYYLGIGLTSLINIFNPEVIVIGGGVADGWDLFINHIEEQVKARAFIVPSRRVKIVRAKCGDDAGILGAASLGFDQINALKK